ncbi:U1 small nuclear ribonucleoprotein 70 kDa [Venturia nashicola]|uniref:U1 small nuclear ribonucleoprotein 70 kDa n=1 Tax=Venturia nashicola TaxID=86259 RepID=A0A4Z1P3Z2_9PEZI|nr:U1 small nuclear ribonucleoprotein 70 kDa [Venturia nashicola]TLD29472.1 U1 small nuclear ribonucleoprotein 70 kDa [Venturia nashicola]
MTDKLPPALLTLFTPRPPLKYLTPSDHAAEDRRTAPISGVAEYMQALKEYKETDVYHPTESHQQKKDRLKLEKKEAQQHLLTEGIKDYQPANDPKISGDAFKTLFVGRLSYEATETDLEREFGRFGPIDKIRIVMRKNVPEDAPIKKRHAGYAFIVFEREKDMKAAYKETDNIRIKDRRIIVDVERGRTVAGWRPTRFGGGLGGRHYTKVAAPRPPGPGGYGGPPAGPGGFRGGGYRGGFQGGRGGGGFRGGFDGSRGGGGYRGGFDSSRGGGGYGGGRGGIGYQQNGFGGAPDGAPAGPRGPRGGGFGGDRGGGYGDRSSYGDRQQGASGSNREPVGPRGGGGGYRDRDQYGGPSAGGRDGAGRDDRKRPYDGDGYNGGREKRRQHGQYPDAGRVNATIFEPRNQDIKREDTDQDYFKSEDRKREFTPPLPSAGIKQEANQA